MSDNESNSLEHSNDGISVLYQFNETKVMLYVEGVDDIPFWNGIFSKYAPKGFYELEQTHGKKGLKKYIDGICDGSLKNVMVACDSDYSSFSENQSISHPLIVTTYGHSIENSMFCAPMMASYITRLSTTTDNQLPMVFRWISSLEEHAHKLLVIDILNDLKPRGNSCRCLTLGFPRFSNGKGYFDVSKVSEFLDSVDAIYTEQEKEEVEAKVKKCDKPIYKILQGHFLEGATNEFIRKVTNCQLSRNAIYAEFSTCRRSLCEELCADIQYVKTEIESAVSYVNSHC